VSSALLLGLGLALAAAPEAPRGPVAPVEPAAPGATTTATTNATSTSTPTATSTATSTPTATPNSISTPTALPAAGQTPPGKVPGSWSAHPFSAAGAKGEKAPARSLTGTALAEELREASRRRQADLESLRSERERLEKLRQDIGEARAALKEETARLEQKIQSAARLPPGKVEQKGPVEPGKGPIDGAAKALRGMKPDQAVQLLGKLERPLAVELLRRMRPAEAAALLDRMKPEAAAELVVALAGGRR